MRYICWVDVMYWTCLVFFKSPWWLVWIFCTPTSFLNFKNKIIEIEHKKIFRGSSKILKNISWPINICLKYFMTPTKTLCPPPPLLSCRYLMYGPLLHYLWIHLLHFTCCILFSKYISHALLNGIITCKRITAAPYLLYLEL